MDRVDHLVYATPDLAQGIAEIERRTGVRATIGGSHPSWGTRNALACLGEKIYLEIVGPDPDRSDFVGDRIFQIDQLEEPRLVTWAARASNLEEQVASAKSRGVECGLILDGSRQRPDGSRLHWRLTDPRSIGDDGLRPFLIDWGESPHPAQSAARGLHLEALRGEHPDVSRVRAHLGGLGLSLPLSSAPVPALVATLGTPKGQVELR